jgi:hypothetical protein
MNHIPTFDEFVNEALKEAGDPAYWNQYAKGHATSEPWMKDFAKNEKEVKDLVDRVINFWDENNEDEGTVSEKGREEILNQSMEYFKKYRKINGYVVDAMVFQTQYIEYK